MSSWTGLEASGGSSAAALATSAWASVAGLTAEGRGTMHVEQAVADSSLISVQQAHSHPVVFLADAKSKLPAPVAGPPKENPPKLGTAVSAGLSPGAAASEKLDLSAVLGASFAALPPKTNPGVGAVVAGPKLNGLELVSAGLALSAVAVAEGADANEKPPEEGAPPKEKAPTEGRLEGLAGSSLTSGEGVELVASGAAAVVDGRGTIQVEQVVADSGLSASQHAHFHPAACPVVKELAEAGEPPKEKPPAEGPNENPEVLASLLAASVVAAPSEKLLVAVGPPNAKPPGGVGPKENGAGLLAVSGFSGVSHSRVFGVEDARSSRVVSVAATVLGAAGRGTMQVEQVVADSELSPSQHAHFHPLVADELSAVLDAPVKEKPEDVAPPKENPLDDVGSASGSAAADDVGWPKAKPPLDGAEVLAAVPL